MPRDLDANKVPEILRPAIPFAESWRAAKHDYSGTRITWDEVISAIAFAEAHDVPRMEKALRDLEKYSNAPADIRDELLALSGFFRTLERLKGMASGNEYLRLLGYTKDNISKPADIKGTQLFDASFDLIEQKLTLKMSLLMDGNEQLPFAVHLLDVHKLDMRKQLGVTLYSGGWNVLSLALRDAPEFVRPGYRHCTLVSGLVDLKAEYLDVVVEKDW